MHFDIFRLKTNLGLLGWKKGVLSSENENIEISVGEKKTFITSSSMHHVCYPIIKGGFIKDGGNVTGFFGFVFSSSNSASLLKI
jgi:hypothetical protein